MCPAGSGKISRHAAQEHERRCAKMGYKPGKEQERCSIGQVRRLRMMITIKIPHMVDGHNDHHQTAQNVDRGDALFLSGFSKCCGFVINRSDGGHKAVSLLVWRI